MKRVIVLLLALGLPVHTLAADTTAPTSPNTPIPLTLDSPFGPVQATPVLFQHVVYLRVRFTNTTRSPIAFGPEQVMLSRADGTLLPSLTPEQALTPLIKNAADLQTQADRTAAYDQGRDHDIAVDARHQQWRADHGIAENTTDNKTAKTVGAVGGILDLIGLFTQPVYEADLQKQADDARAYAAALEENLERSQLQYHSVPPGTTAEGLMYFAAPAEGNATLRVVLKDQTLIRPLPSLPGA
jgi:hypothetical protein